MQRTTAWLTYDQKGELWGLELEIERWYVLLNDEHNNNLSDTDISELVFAEDWLEKLKEVHMAKMNSATS